jgi:hypothetical protein
MRREPCKFLNELCSITVLLEVLCVWGVSLVNDHEVLRILVRGFFILTLEILVGVLVEDIVKHVDIPLQGHIGKWEYHGHLQSIRGSPHFIENEGPKHVRGNILQSEVEGAVKPHQAVNRFLKPERSIIEEERGWQPIYLLWDHSRCEVLVING